MHHMREAVSQAAAHDGCHSQRCHLIIQMDKDFNLTGALRGGNKENGGEKTQKRKISKMVHKQDKQTTETESLSVAHWNRNVPSQM